MSAPRDALSNLPRELTEGLSDDIRDAPPPPTPVLAEPYALRLADPDADMRIVAIRSLKQAGADPVAWIKSNPGRIRSIHCKDGTWAARPGQEWGAEVPLGEGDVGMENYLRTLYKIGYQGPLTIEREIPQEPERQKAEIGRAVRLLEELKAKILS